MKKLEHPGENGNEERGSRAHLSTNVHEKRRSNHTLPVCAAWSLAAWQRQVWGMPWTQRLLVGHAMAARCQAGSTDPVPARLARCQQMRLEMQVGQICNHLNHSVFRPEIVGSYKPTWSPNGSQI